MKAKGGSYGKRVRAYGDCWRVSGRRLKAKVFWWDRLLAMTDLLSTGWRLYDWHWLTIGSYGMTAPWGNDTPPPGYQRPLAMITGYQLTLCNYLPAMSFWLWPAKMRPAGNDLLWSTIGRPYVCASLTRPRPVPSHTLLSVVTPHPNMFAVVHPLDRPSLRCCPWDCPTPNIHYQASTSHPILALPETSTICLSVAWSSRGAIVSKHCRIIAPFNPIDVGTTLCSVSVSEVEFLGLMYISMVGYIYRFSSRGLGLRV